MFAVLKNILANKGGTGRPNPEDLEGKRHIAAGVLLLEAAHSNDEYTDKERKQIVSALKEKFSLSGEEVAELLDLAHAEREQSIDLWQFTNHVNQHFSVAEKQAVMEDVWCILLLDDHLDGHEDQFAHKLANLLRLSHQQLIDAKLKARKLLGRGN